MNKQILAVFFLRISLAVVFLYAAISSFIQPENWSGFIPTFMKAIIPASIFLIIFSIVEIALAAWLLSGKFTRAAAIISSILLFSIIVLNTHQLEIIFRDIAIFFAAIALAILSKT